MPRSRYVAILVSLAILVVVSMFLGISVGPVHIPLATVFHIVRKQLENAIRGGGTPSPATNPYYEIVVDIREPRTFAALLGGAALAVAGLLLQVLFRNPIVGPYVLGISSCATLFVALAILLGVTFGVQLGLHAVVAAAFLGALVDSVLILLIANIVRSIVTLLVLGMLIGYFCSAVTNILIVLSEQRRVHYFLLWTFGSFANYLWSEVLETLAVVIPLVVASMTMSGILNVMLMGEDYAYTTGVNVKLVRVAVIGISSALTAVVTSFAGPIAFIGVAVPLMARALVRTSNNLVLIPTSALLGAIITCLCDVVARSLLPIELPISAVTSIIGVPILAYMLLRRGVRM